MPPPLVLYLLLLACLLGLLVVVYGQHGALEHEHAHAHHRHHSNYPHLKDRKSPHCGTWQRNYTALHHLSMGLYEERLRAASSSNQSAATVSPPRILIYKSPNSGITDRLVGIITGFYTAVLSNRVFLVSDWWTYRDVQVDLARALAWNHVNLTLPYELEALIRPPHNRYTHLNYINTEPLLSALTNPKFDKLAASQAAGGSTELDREWQRQSSDLRALFSSAANDSVLLYESNRGNTMAALQLVHALLAPASPGSGGGGNGTISSNPAGSGVARLASLLSGSAGSTATLPPHTSSFASLSPAFGIYCAFHYLFAPQPEVTDLMRPLLPALSDDKVIKIGLQIRSGDRGFSFPTATTVDSSAYFGNFFSCAQSIQTDIKKQLPPEPRPARLFLISDSLSLKQDAAAKFNGTAGHGQGLLVDLLHRPMHVGISNDVNDLSKNGSLAMRLAVADLLLLSQCDYFVVSHDSGLGKLGALISPGSHEGRVYVANEQGCHLASDADLAASNQGARR